jgi:uncharacterized protein (TIGR00255 family)
MIRSMTGFARIERPGPWGTLACELRSVNHRYLEVAMRLPEDLRPLETECRRLITTTLRRGKVDCTWFLRASGDSAATLEIDETALANLLDRLAMVRARMDEAASVSPLDVLRWPGVTREPERDSSAVSSAAIEMMNEALRGLEESRAREGARIHELIAQRCAALHRQVAEVRVRLPEVNERVAERLRDRIAELGAAPDRDRLEQELVIYAHKLDVAEELDRLDGHVEEILRALDSHEPAGRRLDFLLQEMNREANTLSSKSQDVDTTRIAVEMKVCIEQMREQVQNVE